MCLVFKKPRHHLYGRCGCFKQTIVLAPEFEDMKHNISRAHETMTQQ